MGLGLYENGSGISATRFLVKAGAKVTVTDLKTAEQLAPTVKRLGKLKDQIKLVLGKHEEKDFTDADLIVRNPGVPRKSKYLELARKNNIPVENDISIFFQLIDRKRTIAVTGTRGKSTTTTLIYDLIKAVDKDAVLGGNITQSPLSQMAEVKKGGRVVLELSSWMLEQLGERKLSPHIGVFTNIYPDHLNTYDDIDDYAEAKANIFLWQNPQDYIVLNRENIYTKKMGERVAAQRFWFSVKEFKEENGCFVRAGNIWFRLGGKEEKVLPISKIKIPGLHNLQNILGAVCVGMIVGLSPQKIEKIVSGFKGVANRLELLREWKGRKIYNDTTATTPEATMSALKALGDRDKKIVLIAGGSDKGLDFSVLSKEMKKFCRGVILLNGTGTERLKKLLPAKLVVAHAGSMKEAVDEAMKFSTKGDIIILSPACASFGMFNNEFDRGDQFRKIITAIK